MGKIMWTYKKMLNGILTIPHHIVESIFQAAVGYSPVVQLFCAVIKKRTSSGHVTNLNIAAMNNKTHHDSHKPVNKRCTNGL